MAGPGGQILGAAPSHMNEATAMRNSGVKSNPLFGNSPGATRSMLT